MATIKNFNTENFNVKVVDAMNLQQNWYAWYLDLKVEVTDKETGIKVYDTVLKSRMVPMWDIDEEWYYFIENKIEDGAELDEKDLAEIFDEGCYNLVIIDGDNVWFTDRSVWDEIGYNADTENEVYECDEYIIEKTGWNKYELRDKNDIKIVKDLFEEAA